MQWLKSVLIVLVVLVSISRAEGEHGAGASATGAGTGRPEATTTDRSKDLLSKISACLDARPASADASAPADTQVPTDNAGTSTTGGGSSSSGPSSSPSTTDKSTASTGSGNGAALFTQYCASCHSAGGSQGAIKNNSLGASRVLGDSMPPKSAKQPSASEKQAIAAYLKSK